MSGDYIKACNVCIMIIVVQESCTSFWSGRVSTFLLISHSLWCSLVSFISHRKNLSSIIWPFQNFLTHQLFSIFIKVCEKFGDSFFGHLLWNIHWYSISWYVLKLRHSKFMIVCFIYLRLYGRSTQRIIMARLFLRTASREAW